MIPDITIITPTHNRGVELRRAIGSVLGQKHTRFEYLIVDDGSTDNSEDVVRSFGDRRLRCIRLDENRGANYARNEGVRQSRAPIVTFLDSDDEFLEHRLEQSLETLSRPGLEAMVSSYRLYSPQGSKNCVNRDAEVPCAVFRDALAARTIFVAGSGISVHRQAFVRSGGFNTSLKRLQDREFLFRLSEVCDIAVRSNIDWVKNATANSISNGPVSYIQAYADMVQHCEPYRDQYRWLSPAVVAAQIMSELAKGRIASAHATYAFNRQSLSLGYTPWDIVSGGFVAAIRLSRLRRLANLKA